MIEPESRLAAAPRATAASACWRRRRRCAAAPTRARWRAHAPDALLTSVACPDLAPIIQQGFPFDRRVVETVRGYCAPLREAGVDTVILGCTHYPLIAPMLQRMLGPDVAPGHLGALARADRARPRSSTPQLGATRAGEGDYRFLCTGDVDAFREVGSRFLQMPIEQIEHVGLPLAEAA